MLYKYFEKQSSLEPFFLFKPQNASYYYRDTYGYNDGIAYSWFKCRHVLEIHAVPACYQSKWGEYGCDHSEQGHYPVLFLIDPCLYQFPELNCVVTKIRNSIAEPFYTLCEKSEITYVVIFKESVFIFLQFLAKVYQTAVVQVKIK